MKGLVYVIGGILGGVVGLTIMEWLSLPVNPFGLVFLPVGAGVGAAIADRVAKFMR